MSIGKWIRLMSACLVIGCVWLVDRGNAQTLDIETDGDVLTVQQRQGSTEMGRYVSKYVYASQIGEADWEAVAGLYEQCLAYRFHQRLKRAAKSDDVFSEILVVHDAMQRVPDKYTGRKAAFNNTWYWKGLLVPTFGLRHRDAIILEAGNSRSEIVDGINSSLIEYSFDFIIAWEAPLKRLTVTVAPLNVGDHGSIIPDSQNWLSFSELPLNLRLFSVNTDTEVAESISGGIGKFSLNAGFEYKYMISRDRWNCEVYLGPCVQAEFGRIGLHKLQLGSERWYELHLRSVANPYVFSNVDESLATVTQQVCSTEKSLNVTAEIEVKKKTGSLEFESETKSKCVGTGSTAAASVYANVSTNFGDGLVADHVMTTRVFGPNRAVSFTRPEFATDLIYSCGASVTGIVAPPIVVTSNGGQPALPVNKVYKREF